MGLIAHADHGIDAYSIQAGVSGNQLPEHALNGKGYLVKPNPFAIRNNHITFQFPGGNTLVAERERMVSDARGTSWVGKFQGALGGIVILSHRKGIVSGIIDDGENLYEMVPGRSGKTLLFKVDSFNLPPLAQPLVSEDLGGSDGGAGPETIVTLGTVQDLMLVYTPSVRSSYGGIAATESALLNNVIAINQVYINSLVDIQLNVVHIAEIAYTESGDMGTTLSHLRGKTDGNMDEVHGIRDTHGADLVAMVSTDTNYCGIAYLMTNDSTSFEYLAFSVTNKSCVSAATMDHELGHNQGNCHNREETGCNSPAYPYGYGLCGPTFRTIMSYSAPCGTGRLRQFSNPKVSIGIYPTGIDHNVDPINSADSARTMNNTAATVAAFRTSTTPIIPLSPSNLVVTTQSDSAINLQWLDNSSDESGFKIERSPDGTSYWSPLITLGSNATNYSDTGLTANTLYYYRLLAYNGVGNSAWSNVDGTQTAPPPTPPSAPGSFLVEAISSERIDLSWADVANEDGYRIERSTDDANYVLIASPAADSTSHSDTYLLGDTTYYYRIFAFNNGGDSPASSGSATTLSFTDYTAISESIIYGSLLGSYADTSSDDSVERITETESGGKPARRHSRAQHRWQFNLSAGNSTLLIANAWKSGTDEDDFNFEYSTDGSSYSPAFVVSSESPANEQAVLLPSGISGAFYVRVTDTDQTEGNRNLDSINIDHLYVHVENGDVGSVPIAPTDLGLTATTGQIDLAWTDLSDDEIGFEIESSEDGSNWQSISNTGANTESHTDSGLVGNTTYYYRVRAYNAAGASTWAGPVSATTPAGLTLVANGSKVKGRQRVGLNWTGGTAQSDVYRDENLIITTTGSSYTDLLNTRGGGTYVYKVCAAGTNTCSNEATVVF